MALEENFIVGKDNVLLDKSYTRRSKNKMFKLKLEKYKQQLENKKCIK